MLTAVAIAAGIILVFVSLRVITKMRNRVTGFEVADIIERFVEGKGEAWEWDDFISSQIRNPELEAIRVHCNRLDKEFPPDKSGMYTSEKGLEVLRAYVRGLRAGSAQEAR